MVKNKQFYILTEDFDIIERVSPSIMRTFDSLFFVQLFENKVSNISYCVCRFKYKVLHHANKRCYLSLVHSCHVVACDLYKHDRFEEYMAFDALLVHLISML